MTATLVLGGARSGKSYFAQQLAVSSTLPVLYIATATALDDEMVERIAHHKKNRPGDWRLVECPLDLVDVLKDENNRHQIILIDCLTLWLNNQLFSFPEQDFEFLSDELMACIASSSADLVFVANEVGLGIIPLGSISRKFVDEAGRLNQKIAQAVDTVFFIAAGLPFILKSEKDGR